MVYISYTILALNIHMATSLYKTQKRFICTFLFVLSELSKLTLFKEFILDIIEAKVAEKCHKKKSNFGLKFRYD